MIAHFPHTTWRSNTVPGSGNDISRVSSRDSYDSDFPDVPDYVHPTLERLEGLPPSIQEEFRVYETQTAWFRRKFGLSGYFHMYTMCALFASMGCFMTGLDTGSIGPITLMPQFRETFSPVTPLLQGLIVSSILMAASVSAIFVGPFSDRFSRTHLFASGGAIFGIGSLVTATAGSLPVLLAGRMLAGIGEGIYLSTITIYIVEIAPTNSRGALSSIVQLYITMGISLGFFVSYGSVQIASSLSWRLPFIIQTVLAMQFAIGSLFLPHSPRWLQHVGRVDDATRTWGYLGFTAIEMQKEQEFVQRQANAAYMGWLATARMLWSKDTKQRTFLGVFLMAMQQACGINAIIYYAPVLFAQAGLEPTSTAFLASGISTLLNIIYTIVVRNFTDTWGRRKSVIIGGTTISAIMLLIGTLYATRASESPAGRWIIVACLYLFLFVFSMSWAVVTRLYCSEIQPIRTRAAAMSLGQCAHWTVDWIVALTAPLYLSKSASGPYFTFGACALLTAVVCVLFQPESRGITLEGLDALFEVSPWRKLLARYAPRAHAGREEPIALRPA